MEKEYTIEKFSKDLDNGFVILYNYVKNRYKIYKVTENCYMQELIEQHSKNPLPPKGMLTWKSVEQAFPFMTNIEYKQENY